MMITQTTRIMSAYNAMCKRGRKINESVDELYDEDTEPIDTDTEDVDIESLISDDDDEDTTDIEDIEDVDSLEDDDEKEVPFEDEISESAKKCCGKKRCCNGKKGKKHCQCHSAYDTLGGQEVCESEDMPVREKFDMISDEILQKMDTTELDGHDVVTKLLECLKQISDMELEKVVDCIETTVLGKAEQEDADAIGDDEIPELA